MTDDSPRYKTKQNKAKERKKQTNKDKEGGKSNSYFSLTGKLFISN
jgi:hypothetical protein